MRFLIVLIVSFLTACGGGSSSPASQQPDPVIITPPPAAVLYEYSISPEGDSRSYSGYGVRYEDTIYFYPEFIANSPFVVTGEVMILSDDDSVAIRLFDYHSGFLTLDFEASISNREGYHNGVRYSFDLIELIGGADYDGEFSYLADNGCNYHGVISGVRLYLQVSDCPLSGSYEGAALVNNGVIYGAATNAVNGVSVRYEL